MWNHQMVNKTSQLTEACAIMEESSFCESTAIYVSKESYSDQKYFKQSDFVVGMAFMKNEVFSWN